MQDLLADLQKAIGVQQVKFDHMTRLLYSTDASNYQIMPIGVTFPRDGDDVVAIHEVANRHQTALLPRGGGSSLAGQTVGQAIVMDFSRHMRRVRGVNAEEQCVLAEPGLVLEHLNRQVRALGLMYGPDPASANRATVGGCIGNNSTGAHSILYGMTSDHIRRLEVVMADGQRVWLDAQALEPLRQKIGQLTQEHAREIEKRFPKTWRTVAGYALNHVDPSQPNLNWLFAGSEGTLGTIVQAELNLVPVPSHKRLVMVHFDSLRASLEATPRILETSPSAIELMDRFLLDKTRHQPEFASLLTFVDGDPSAILVVEYYGESESELDAKVAELKRLPIIQNRHSTIAAHPQEQANVWTVRKAGLGLLMSERSDKKPIPLIEDVAVPVERLADYIDDVEQIIHGAGTDYAIYAHASAGCLHVRPLVNLKTTRGHEQYREIAEATANLVVKYEGTLTGEHGEGIVRSEFSEHIFGTELMAVFRQIKHLFDPQNLMNPGKVIDAPRIDDPTMMRFSPAYTVIPLQTRFDWSADNGLNGAAEMCNGAGVCRKEGSGTMCPSYMATLDEAHATRGRANALRQAMSGQIDLASPDVYDVFDLCLSCKACKAECPSTVDVARMKAEFQAAYYDKHGVPLQNRVFGNIHRLNALGGFMPQLSNVMLNSPIGKMGMKLFGIPTERPLPPFARKRFSKSVPHSPQAQATLIIDTFTEFNHPEVGHAALKIAEATGLKLNTRRLPGGGCCGRPAISKGLLDQGKRMAERNVQALSQMNGPFIFLEPSCMSAFVDDYLTLVSPTLQSQARQVADQCMMADAWLLQHIDAQIFDDQPREILLHGHCHQKALWGTQESLALLRLIPAADVREIDSGCCGVAGSFGYEHYELSMKIGQQRLLPTIANNPQAIVAAPGTSCRAQVHDAGYAVKHPLEVVAEAIR